MALGGDLQDRLRDLIAQHRLEPIAEEILRHAAPCITLKLKDLGDPFGSAKTLDPPMGSSRMGGMPYVPQAFEWPMFECAYGGDTVRSGFLMQLDLAALPEISDSPLPRAGLLSLFHRDQCAPFRHSYEAFYFAPDVKLERRAPPDDLRCASELEVCESGAATLLRAVVGLDAPTKGSHDILSATLHDRFEGDPDWVERLGAFLQRARDPEFETHEQAGDVLGWWIAGQMFGRMDDGSAITLAVGDGDPDAERSEAENAALAEEGRRAWRLLLQLESNWHTGFRSNADTAPVLIMARGDRPVPWSDIGPVQATMAL